MKRKKIIGGVLIVLVLAGGVVGYKLLNKDDSTKANVKQQDSKTFTVKDMTNKKPKATAGVNKIDYKKLYSVANKEGNIDSNLFNGGLIAQQDKWLYYNSNGLYMSLTDLKTGEKKITDDIPHCIQVIGDWIYYLNSTNQLIKIKADGSGRAVINKGLADYYQVRDEFIYCLEGKQLFKMKLDGSDKHKAMDNGCAFFSVKDNVIYYVNVSDRKLHKVLSDGSCDECITAERCPAFIIKGDWLYCTSYGYGIYKIKLDGTSNTKLMEDQLTGVNIDDEYIYYSVNNIVNAKADFYRMKLDGTEKTKFLSLNNKNNRLRYAINVTSENVYVFSESEKTIYKFNK